MLYPLKFKTIFKDKLWGGEKIKTVLGKDFGTLPNCGETWELSGVKGDVSIVDNGPHKGKQLTKLIDNFQGDLVGNDVYEKYGNEFPLLIKFIDANQDLSVQVHPNDDLAMKRHQSFGKTEMWYVLQADEGSSLISGFNQPMNKEKYLENFESGNLMNILNTEKVQKGDVFFLPAGRVHTIGKGLLIAEIQQTSDITYRIYDFDRKDANGHLRELHVDEALDAIDYTYHDSYKTSYEDAKDQSNTLVSCQYFTTNKLRLSRNLNFENGHLDSFKIYVCLSGEAIIVGDDFRESIGMGDVVLIPAKIKKYTFETDTGVEMLESYISND